jgi:hypothetical protein
MSENNELSPEIEAVLKDISAVDPAVRDQHIAAALGELTVQAQSNNRLRFISAAAAVVVLVAGGIAFSRNSNDTPPALAADTTAISVPKASAECTHTGGFWGDVGRVEGFAVRGASYELVLRKGTVEVLLGTQPCTRVDEIVYFEAMRRRDNQNESPSKTTCEEEPLLQFVDNSGGLDYKLALLRTDNGVSLFFEDRCNEPLGSITLPASGD